LNNLGDFDNPVAYKHAQTICDRIALDIVTGNFTATNNGELTLRYHPSGVQRILRTTKELKPNSTTDQKTTILTFLESRLNHKYNSSDKAVYNRLVNYESNITTSVDAQRFVNDLVEKGLSGATIQRYLNTIKQCCDLFSGIKVSVVQNKPIIPFTKEEVGRICEWFADNVPHYAPYVRFAFLTGMRPSEIIGLEWDNVDFARRKIYIVSVLGRDGTNTSKRERRLPKSNVQRTFPINEGLFNLLNQLDVSRNGLVFRSVSGGCIDDHNFSQRHWKRCLRECGIKHNDFYNCRRTFISHFLYETKDVVKCAKLTHNTKSGIQTLFKYYAGVLNEDDMPELYT
jgi:integrase